MFINCLKQLAKIMAVFRLVAIIVSGEKTISPENYITCAIHYAHHYSQALVKRSSIIQIHGFKNFSNLLGIAKDYCLQKPECSYPTTAVWRFY